ncbi:MAG: cytochrome c oxidase assembly protein [Thiobacillus sp.]|nr:cytochrome c oxidase assembly protein [Thiobacillus sp.]
MREQRLLTNAALLRKLLLFTVAMFGFAYALVPLYRTFCDLTGLNRDEAQVLARNTQVDLSRRVQVQLLADSSAGAAWRLTAPAEAITPHPGELVEVEYQLDNLGDQPLVGQAVPSYAPAEAAAYFKKIECFCFREQRLAPHESRRLPVLFVLDRQLPPAIGVVTLSYRFYARGES